MITLHFLIQAQQLIEEITSCTTWLITKGLQPKGTSGSTLTGRLIGQGRRHPEVSIFHLYQVVPTVGVQQTLVSSDNHCWNRHHALFVHNKSCLYSSESRREPTASPLWLSLTCRFFFNLLKDNGSRFTAQSTGSSVKVSSRILFSAWCPLTTSCPTISFVRI